MDRQTILAILSTASDEHLMAAMSALGIPVGGSGAAQDFMQPGAGLEGWDAKDVRIAPPRKPAFLDPSKFVAEQPQQEARPLYLNMGEDTAGLDEYAATVQNLPLGV